MRAYVGVTDGDWFRHLASRPTITEVNFWTPSARVGFKALNPGEPFLFKTHHPHNQLVGGGHFEGFTRLRISDAWEFFGEGNGVGSLEELRLKIAKYHSQPLGPYDDPEIGCILLNHVHFMPAGETIAAPDDFAKNIVKGKGYSVLGSGSNPIVDEFVSKIFTTQTAVDIEIDKHSKIDGPMFGDARLTVPRLGQGAFKALVLDAYDKRCSITGHKIAPTLQAAHILPVSRGGEHRLDNGLLLRSDVHTMFDRGYLGVDIDYRLRVSPRLRSEFGNGDEFYSRQGTVIALPASKVDRPHTEFLEWHMDEVFKAT